MLSCLSAPQCHISPSRPTSAAGQVGGPQPGWTLDTENDWRNDGAFVVAGGKTLPADTPLDKLKAYQPDNGAAVHGSAVMVNGIMTDVALQSADLQALANQGYSVIGVHNATKGMFRDLAQCLGDKLDLQGLANNRAVETTTSLIAASVSKGEPLRLVGHSQGALVISCALDDVREQMLAHGRTEQQIEQAFSVITVTSLGGAAATYAKGPTYDHYYNRFDMVPMLAGRPLMAALQPLPKEALHGSQVVRRPENLPPWSNGISNRLARLVDGTTHGPRDIYLPQLGNTSSLDVVA